MKQDAQHPNPLVRALAVRTMGCIRVDKITEYLCQPLRECLKVPCPSFFFCSRAWLSSTRAPSLPWAVFTCSTTSSCFLVVFAHRRAHITPHAHTHTLTLAVGCCVGCRPLCEKDRRGVRREGVGHQPRAGRDPGLPGHAARPPLRLQPHGTGILTSCSATGLASALIDQPID